MTVSPSSKVDWASGLALGRATAAIGLDAWLLPAERGPPQRASTTTMAASARPASACVRLLITSHLFDSLEADARLAAADRRAQLGLLGVLVLGQAGERLADLLRVLVVDADLDRAGVAGLVGVEGLVLDDDDDLLELV